MHAGLTEAFDGGEEACSAGRAAGGKVLFDLTAGGVVPDTALMKTRERVAVPEMLNDREKRQHDVNAMQFALI